MLMVLFVDGYCAIDKVCVNLRVLTHPSKVKTVPAVNVCALVTIISPAEADAVAVDPSVLLVVTVFVEELSTPKPVYVTKFPPETPLVQFNVIVVLLLTSDLTVFVRVLAVAKLFPFADRNKPIALLILLKP